MKRYYDGYHAGTMQERIYCMHDTDGRQVRLRGSDQSGPRVLLCSMVQAMALLNSVSTCGSTTMERESFPHNAYRSEAGLAKDADSGQVAEVLSCFWDSRHRVLRQLHVVEKGSPRIACSCSKQPFPFKDSDGDIGRCERRSSSAARTILFF